MRLLRQYQLEMVGGAIVVGIILWTSFYLLSYFGSDPRRYEWPISAPFLILYATYFLRLRNKISLADRRRLTTWSLIKWVALGIVLVLTTSTPISAREYASLKLLYIAFTIFLADSYFDFRNITLKSLSKKDN